MASRYYYELPVDGCRRPAGYEGGRDHGRGYPDDAPPATFQASSDPRSYHMTRDHHMQGAPAASTSYDHGHHGSVTVQDLYRRDWRDQGREGRSFSGYGVAPVEQVHTQPNSGWWMNSGFPHGGHDGYQIRLPVHNSAEQHERKTVSLWVPLCCEKCEREVRENLEDIDGVESVTTDQFTKKVVVVGTMRPDFVLSRARQDKAQSQFWSDHQRG